MDVLADRTVLGHKRQAVLDGGCIDQPIGGIAGKGRGQSGRGVGDGRGDADRAQLRGQSFKPGPDWDLDENPLVPREPGQLEPRDGGDGKLLSPVERVARRLTDALGLGRPPVDDVGVKQQRAHISRGVPWRAGRE
jgi:hypothetical protein